MPNPTPGDHITVGNIVNSVGVAIGHDPISLVVIQNYYDKLIFNLGEPSVLNLDPQISPTRLPFVPPHPHSLEPELNCLIGRHAELAGLVELLLRTVDGLHGGTVWITGHQGMGRKALGRKLIDLAGNSETGIGGQVQSPSPRVLSLSTRFWKQAQAATDEQNWYAAEPWGKGAWPEWHDYVRRAFPRASREAGPAWVALASQAMAGMETSEVPRGLPDEPASLTELVRQASRKYDASVLLLEEYDQAGPAWDRLVEALAREAARDLKLIVLVTSYADRPVSLDAGTGLSPELILAQDLAKRELATVLWLGPLEYADLAQAFPEAEGIIPEKLFQMADGNPLWIEKLLNDWAGLKFIVQDSTGAWRPTRLFEAVVSGTTKNYAEFLLRRALEDKATGSNFTFETASELLRCATLEGVIFTVQAVAEACGLNTTEVSDFFSQHMCGENGLLRRAPNVTIESRSAEVKRIVRRFYFNPAAAYYAFAKYATPTEQRAPAYRMADSLEKAYWPYPEQVAQTLGRLFELGGTGFVDERLRMGEAEEKAERIRRTARNSRMNHYRSLRVNDRSIEAQLKEVELLSRWAEDKLSRVRLVTMQIELALRILDVRPIDQPLTLAQDAVENSRSLNWAKMEARAEELIGACYLRMGDYQKAITALTRGFEIAKRCGSDEVAAASLDGLGTAALFLGNYATACDYYQRALALNEALGYRTGVAKSLGGLGQVAYYQEQHLAARDYEQRALALNEQMGDQAERAFNLTCLGDVAVSLGENEAARECYQRALALLEELGHQAGIASVQKGMGNVAQNLGEHGAAREYYQRALVLFEQLGRRADVSSSLAGLGDVAESLGEHQAAHEYYQRALVVAEQLGRQANIANIEARLGRIALRDGDYRAAYGRYQRALAVNDRLGRHVQSASNLRALGDAARALGKLRDAREYFQRAVALGEQLGLQGELKASLTGLGLVMGSFGEHNAAREYLQRALTLTEQMNAQDSIAVILVGLGSAAARVGDYGASREYYQRALTVVEREGNKHGIAASLNGLGLAAMKLDQKEAARDYFQRALALYEELGRADEIAATLTLLGNLEYESGEHRVAREYHQRALVVLDKVGRQDSVATNLMNLGATALKLGELGASREYFGRALTLTEQLGSQAGIAFSLVGLGDAAQGFREFDAARDYYQRALHLYSLLSMKAKEESVRRKLDELEAGDASIQYAQG